MDTFDLKERAGLPEGLTALLEAFPRETWNAHPNFSGLVAFWLDRHVLFRKLCHSLSADVEATMDGAMPRAKMAQRLSRHGSMLLQNLHGHHQIEDQHYFPLLSAREAALDHGFRILDRDHHAMDGLIDRFATRAKGVLGGAELGPFHTELAEFQRLLLRHLEDEEDLIVPVILKHGPDGLN